MNRYLLDTHIWIWAQLQIEDRLSKEAVAEIESWQRDGSLFVSPISAWEMAFLEQSKQVDLGSPVEIFVSKATEDHGFQLTGLSPTILIASTRLPGDIHRDPADRILVATARELGMTLVTRDKLLLDYAKKGHLNARRM